MYIGGCAASDLLAAMTYMYCTVILSVKPRLMHQLTLPLKKFPAACTPGGLQADKLIFYFKPNNKAHDCKSVTFSTSNQNSIRVESETSTYRDFRKNTLTNCSVILCVQS